MKQVKPIGILSLLESGRQYGSRADDMRRASGQLDSDMRRITASYLRKGSVVLAIMEYTTDILDPKFGTSGGSGILTDGEYYWRGDAAHYVERYGVGLDQEFLWRIIELDGEPPRLTADEIIEVDEYFQALRRPRLP
jgi:hypothetical protein